MTTEDMVVHFIAARIGAGARIKQDGQFTDDVKHYFWIAKTIKGVNADIEDLNNQSFRTVEKRWWQHSIFGKEKMA